MSLNTLRKLAPSSLREVTRKRAYSRMSESYIRMSWTRRVLIALATLVVLALAVIQTQPERTFAVLTYASIFLVITHVMLRYPNIVKVALVWLINAVTTATVATTVIYMYQGINEQFWNLVTWMTAFLTGSVIILLWNLRYPRGKIWLTLTLAYLALHFSSLIGITLLWNPIATATLSTAVGLTVVFIRYVFPRRKKMLDRLPKPQSEAHAQNFINQMGKKERERFRVLSIEGRPFVSGVSKYGHIYMIELVKTEQPITHDEGEPRYRNVPIAGWLADSYLQARDALPRGTPFIHIIAPVNSYVKGVQTIAITPRNSVTGKTYTSFIISQKSFNDTLRKLIKTHGARIDTANSKQLRTLKKKFSQLPS